MWRSRSPRFWLLIVPLAAACAAGAVILLDPGNGDDSAGPGTGAEPTPPQAPGAAGGPAGDGRRPRAVAPDEERRAIHAVRAYVGAVDDRDGGRVCSMLAPGAIQSFRLPREGGGCAASLSRSIGYRDPRGYPVFASARIDSIGNVAIVGDDARVTATVVTEFADREQPSIEDDLIYLALVDGEWKVARPSAVLYRAVGRPEVPLEAVAPPR